MTTIIDVKVTPQGLLIPHALVAEWREVEVVKVGNQIVVRPKHRSELREREALIDALRRANLTSPLADSPPPSTRR